MSGRKTKLFGFSLKSCNDIWLLTSGCCKKYVIYKHHFSPSKLFYFFFFPSLFFFSSPPLAVYILLFFFFFLQAAANADILSEKVLDDLLEDTAQEFWNMEQHKRLQAESLFVADSLSLETMLQRMEEIEVSFYSLI